MKYILLESDDEKYWLELDDEGYAMRQIISDGNHEMHISCMEDCLAEGVIDVENLDGIYSNLSESEFSNVWHSVLDCYKREWNEIKSKYLVGDYVQGTCRYFYPQGAIIVGEDYKAIYKGIKDIMINQSFSAKIVTYDDSNMWLVLE